MALAGSTIGLIRSFFNKANMLPQPEAMVAMIGQAAYPQYGGTAAGGVGPYSSGNSELQNAMQINNDLLSRYADAQDMCQYPECFTALNLYADEGTQEHPVFRKNFWIECEDETIKNILEFTFHRQLHIEDTLWTMLRTTAKYGNSFYELVVQDGVGVIKLISHKTPYMRRIQDIEGNLFGYLKDPSLSFKITTPEFLKRLHTVPMEEQKKDNIKVYEPWEVCQFRMETEDGDDLYGNGILEGARWAWKRLQQMEDAVVCFKLSRAPQRYAFYVDVGDVPPNEARKILNQVKQEFKKQKSVDPSSGRQIQKYNPLCLSLETKIPLLNGEIKTINQLITDYENGIKNYVYSINRESQTVVPGEIEWAGVTRKNAQVVKVILDNDESIICTPDHEFVDCKGNYVEAINLHPGQSLMPFRRGSSSKGHEYIYQPGITKCQHTHRAVAEYYNDLSENKQVHHKDRNKLNNNPDNLDIVSLQDHCYEHKDDTEEELNDVFLYNNKVKYVEILEEREDTGCITVNSEHNFACSIGIFVKNSVDEDFFIARRKDKRSTEIEVLSGLDGQSVDDTEYFRNKLISALAVPKSYLGYDESIGRANLGSMDIRFAKTVMRLQKSIKNGLKQIANVDLAARNIDPQSVDFDIGMTVPSGVLEITHIEVQKARLELAQLYQGMNFSEHYIWTDILGLSDEEVKEIQDQRVGEASMPGAASGGAGGVSVPSSSSIGGESEPLSPEGEPSGEEIPTPEGTPATPKVEPLNKAGVQHYQTASKYRKIPKANQLHESSDLINEIRSKDAVLARRLSELRNLVQDIRHGMSSRTKRSN